MVPHSFLYYFESETAETPRGVIDLEAYHNCSVEEGDNGGKLLTVAASEASGLRTFFFRCEEEKEMNEWARTLNRERFHQLRSQVRAYRDMQEKFSNEISAEMREKEQAAWTLQVEQQTIAKATSQIVKLISDLTGESYDEEPNDPIFGRNRGIEGSLEKLRQCVDDQRDQVERRIESARTEQSDELAKAQADVEAARAETARAREEHAAARERNAELEKELEKLREEMSKQQFEARSHASNLMIAVGERRALKELVGQLTEQKRILIKEVKQLRARAEEEARKRREAEAQQLRQRQQQLLERERQQEEDGGERDPDPASPSRDSLPSTPTSDGLPSASTAVQRSDSSTSAGDAAFRGTEGSLSDGFHDGEVKPEVVAALTCRRCGGSVAGPRYSTCKCEEPLLGDALEENTRRSSFLSGNLGIDFSSLKSAMSSLTGSESADV